MSQRNLPVMVFAGGFPQIAKLPGDAASYAERLFIYPEIITLKPDAAREAIEKPPEDEGVYIEDAALEMILTQTGGYPFFLQEWGHHACNTAASSPITLDDVEAASTKALECLDNGFFKVRLDRLTRAQVAYVHAMASLGPGP